MSDNSVQILSEITTYMKYAKYIPEINRRESWIELCERNMAMHIRKYPQLRAEIQRVYKEFVFTKKVLPSMRSLQFGGRPIELAPNRIFNCAFMPVDHVDAFSETMFLLLGGTGIGYSVQNRHVGKLPVLVGPNSGVRRYVIGDSIEGWADAVKVLVEAYFYGKARPNFDFSDIRKKGAPLVTSGGKAPGPNPLRFCLQKIANLMDHAIETRGVATQLVPLEVHDIMCHIADAVLAGGIRRAAMICLFDRYDHGMLKAKGNFKCSIEDMVRIDDHDNFNCTVRTKWNDKLHQIVLNKYLVDQQQETGKLPWYIFEAQRGRANNSAVLPRAEITQDEFFDLWQKIEDSGSGEPGVYFSNNLDWGTNPCCKLLAA
jgi:ribonucleoside-diphosphate reductase alpha chain